MNKVKYPKLMLFILIEPPSLMGQGYGHIRGHLRVGKAIFLDNFVLPLLIEALIKHSEHHQHGNDNG